jgi:hypothetical protein
MGKMYFSEEDDADAIQNVLKKLKDQVSHCIQSVDRVPISSRIPELHQTLWDIRPYLQHQQETVQKQFEKFIQAIERNQRRKGELELIQAAQKLYDPVMADIKKLLDTVVTMSWLSESDAFQNFEISFEPFEEQIHHFQSTSESIRKAIEEWRQGFENKLPTNWQENVYPLIRLSGESLDVADRLVSSRRNELLELQQLRNAGLALKALLQTMDEIKTIEVEKIDLDQLNSFESLGRRLKDRIDGLKLPAKLNDDIRERFSMLSSFISDLRVQIEILSQEKAQVKQIETLREQLMTIYQWTEKVSLEYRDKAKTEHMTQTSNSGHSIDLKVLERELRAVKEIWTEAGLKMRLLDHLRSAREPLGGTTQKLHIALADFDNLSYNCKEWLMQLEPLLHQEERKIENLGLIYQFHLAADSVSEWLSTAKMVISAIASDQTPSDQGTNELIVYEKKLQQFEPTILTLQNTLLPFQHVSKDSTKIHPVVYRYAEKAFERSTTIEKQWRGLKTEIAHVYQVLEARQHLEKINNVMDRINIKLAAHEKYVLQWQRLSAKHAKDAEPTFQDVENEFRLLITLLPNCQPQDTQAIESCFQSLMDRYKVVQSTVKRILAKYADEKKVETFMKVAERCELVLQSLSKVSNRVSRKPARSYQGTLDQAKIVQKLYRKVTAFQPSVERMFLMMLKILQEMKMAKPELMGRYKELLNKWKSIQMARVSKISRIPRWSKSHSLLKITENASANTSLVSIGKAITINEPYLI